MLRAWAWSNQALSVPIEAVLVHGVDKSTAQDASGPRA